MPERYSATFDSEHPEQGVVVDEQKRRYALFPSLEDAQEAATDLNLKPQLAGVLVWRSAASGKTLPWEASDAQA